VEHDVYLYAAVIGCTLVGIQVILQVFGLMDMDGDAADATHAADSMDAADAADHGDLHHEGHGSSAFFGVLSFKALCAFAGIFGLVGLSMLETDASAGTRVTVAIAAGVAAMFGVAWMMRSLARLQSSGTVQTRNAVGRSGTVYLKVPAAGGGAGKVTVEVQGRSMEFAAITEGDEIPTGARVSVVSAEGETLKVVPL
jgi:membrane protein implicated in regulation of membrane protease activity